jgi:ABC-2 type transport system ATP-binding protein
VVCQGTPAEVKSMGSAISGASADSKVKIIRCATTLAESTVWAMAGVTSVESSDGLMTVTTSRPEATLRELLALDQAVHSLEVQSPALEDAFLALTANRE